MEGYNGQAANQYLSLIHESDKALEYLISYFEECEEPTLIVMFGDHYPTLPTVLRNIFPVRTLTICLWVSRKCITRALLYLGQL